MCGRTTAAFNSFIGTRSGACSPSAVARDVRPVHSMPQPAKAPQQPSSVDTQDLYRLVIDSVQDYAIFALDKTGHVLTWNAGAQRLKGYAAEEIIGKHFSIFYPPDKVAEKFPEFELKEAAKIGRFENEGWRIRKDGTRFWANVVITALRDKNGGLVGFAKVTRDLTDRRAAEEELRLSEERLRLLVQGVKDYAIFMLDPDGIIATWNEGAERIKGYTSDEAIGQHFSIFYPEDRVASGFPQHELEEANRTGRFEDEGWRIRKDGSRFWANVVITAIRNAAGTLVGFAKITRDLTERRMAEERALEDARRVTIEEIGRLAAERARDRADEANRVKSDFLAAMSHELRTPLNAIGGYADLLLLGVRGPVTEMQLHDLERIRLSQRHLLSVISDLLNFSRIEAGKIEYQITPVVIQEMFESVRQMIAGQADAKGVSLVVEPCDEKMVVCADRARAEQILLNLLSNAVKFTDARGEVRLSCRIIGDDAAIAVTDTGIGIDNDQLERVFEPFVQVGRSLSSGKEGAGLGLAISRDLARAMRGDVVATSKVGEGSTFTVRLPLVEHGCAASTSA
jgi:PAS domain S-box-containing protein